VVKWFGIRSLRAEETIRLGERGGWDDKAEEKCGCSGRCVAGGTWWGRVTRVLAVRCDALLLQLSHILTMAHCLGVRYS
jgi:hypothetical protein